MLGLCATQLIGDFGAEVIKVELPVGDLFQAAPPWGMPVRMGRVFSALNCNKRLQVVLTRRASRARRADDADRHR